MPARGVADDPPRLIDEAAAQSLIGGRRLIRIRDADDGLTGAFTLFFKAPPPGDSLIVLEAGDLSARSRLRILFEGAEAGAALACYVEGEQSLGRVVTDLLGRNGLQADADAISFLSANLVGDRMVARNELEKLALYMEGQKRVTLEDARACIGDSAALEPDEPAWFAADGDFAALDRALVRLQAEGAAPVSILRAAQRHFQRLQLIAGLMGEGKSASAAVESLRPPVFFKVKERLAGQARRWAGAAIRQALERLVDAEADVKRTNMPDQTICARALFQVASLARR